MAFFGRFGGKKQRLHDEDKHPITRAFEQGGEAMERACDALQGRLGPIFRKGGPEAINSFSEFYDLICQGGNADSGARFAKRFFQMLPKRDQEIVGHRCGFDGSAGSATVQWLKRRNEAVGSFVDSMESTGLLARVAAQANAQFEADLRKGGPTAVKAFTDAHKRFEEMGNAVGVRKFERESLPLLPRSERDEVLRWYKQRYTLDPSFRTAVHELDERAILSMIEAHLLSNDS